MSQAIQRYQPQAVIPQGFQEILKIAEMIEASKNFPSIKNAAEAAVRIMMGAEIGLGPMQSVNNIHVVDGKPTLSAGLMGSLMQRSGYSWRILEHTNEICRLEIRHGSEVLGESSFSVKDAEDAQLLNRPPWKKHRRDMLFARAISRAARWYAPGVALGVYLPDEMGEVESAPSVPGPSQSFAPEPAEVEIQEPESDDPDRAMKRIHAVGRDHKLTHEQLRALAGVTSLKGCMESELDALSDAINNWSGDVLDIALTITEAETLPALADAWRMLPKRHQPELRAAKDYRKAELQQQSEEAA